MPENYSNVPVCADRERGIPQGGRDYDTLPLRTECYRVLLPDWIRNAACENPHQRISAADGVEDPLPGFLVGGPNAGRQDAAELPEYPSESPDEAYQDHVGSYASNEIGINWNAYLIALLSWVR